MFTKILIANRGEIACRVIRTAKRMAVKTVAVYSDADQNALHVQAADEAVHIGASPAPESYLCGGKIIAAALATGAEAIHPGYGFLSENPQFVERVEKAGLIFIGPSSSAIRAMGLKDAAKTLMQQSGVPVVPGYHGAKQGVKFLAAQAEKIGYPVLIKARAGGGGKGMRRVDTPKDFAASLEGAKREGKAVFGDGHVLIEKYIAAPRHIEIQVFGDNHGNLVHLFERDCSLQRRHQKVIEEAPAPGMSEEMRSHMGEAALQAAKAVGYSGAGTVEFIVDGSKGLQVDRFWFMEMNTRLQVEHPVTEAITGLDLVEWQLLVASGEKLPKSQDQLAINGHAIEARLYAEDVPKGFLPATGRLDHLVFSALARNDTGVRAGDVITPHYDPIISKMIVHGDTRDEAISKLRRALGETEIAGTTTNSGFLSALICHDGFGKGQFDTGLIERDLDALIETAETPFWLVGAAALIASGVGRPAKGQDPFDVLENHVHWRPTPFWVCLAHRGQSRVLSLCAEQGWRVCEAGQSIHFETIENGGNKFTTAVEGHTMCVNYYRDRQKIAIFADGHSHVFQIPDPLLRDAASEAGDDVLNAPMSGLIQQVLVKAGAKVSSGDPLLVLEAMKMQHTISAPRDGVIERIDVQFGDQVDEGSELVVLEHVDE